jgi:excisionase family DNA binding protein
MSAKEPQQDILTPTEAAELLRVPLSWVYEKSRRRQRNPIPVYRIGRYIRFSRAAVLLWLETQANLAGRKIARTAARA